MSLRIQVVDDSSTIQKVIKIAFTPFHLDVVTSGSYIEALTEIQNRQPDLLIIDANISGGKTLSDIQRLQNEAGGAPVLLLRGSYDGIDEESLEAAGFHNILRKPFESSDIVREAAKLVPIPQGASQPAAQMQTPPPPPSVDSRVSNTRPPVMRSEPTNSGVFMDLSDTTGHSVPLPPPVREASGIMDPPGLPEYKRQQFSSDEPSRSSEPPKSFAAEEIGETLIAQTPPPPPDFSISLADQENDFTQDIQAPHLKGKKAFQTPMEPKVPRNEPTPPQRESSVLEDFKGDVADIRLEIARQMREHLPQLVRESVESYCAIHFPKLVREIVTAELRRLADEKARHLIDN